MADIQGELGTFPGPGPKIKADDCRRELRVA